MKNSKFLKYHPSGVYQFNIRYDISGIFAQNYGEVLQNAFQTCVLDFIEVKLKLAGLHRLNMGQLKSPPGSVTVLNIEASCNLFFMRKRNKQSKNCSR